VQRRQGHDIDALRARAQQVAKANPQVLGIAANFHEGDSPQVLGQETVHLWGESSAFDRNETSTTLATFGSFVQAHRGQASRIHTLVVNFVLGLTRGKGQAPRVLDLYGGSGAISMALLAKGAHVHLVETFAPAVASAQAAAKAVAETNPSSTGALTAECGDVASVIRRIVQKEDGYDAVVVNPPRRGISALAREWISRIPTERLVYVSCNPETLARDLAHFQDLGFEADTLHPIDMIPLSEEVETVAFLRRVAPSSARVLHEDTDLVIIDKGGHEPTMPQGEYSLSALQRVRLEARLPTATPVHRHDVGTSGVLVLSKAPQDVNRWHKVVHEASSRRIFLVAARGITPAKGSITRDLREGGQVFQARTRYRRLAIAGGHSILRVIPEQDHPHQARRHLAAIGHPILGDERYGHGPTNRFFEEKHGLDRTFLHCVRFEFDDPRTNARRFVDAPLPADLLAVVERLGGQETLRFLDHKHALGKGSPPSSVPPPPNSSHTDGGPVDVDASVPSTRHDHTGSYSFDD
jgi:23S rRNA (uracil1939-C5)-methyltransferase